MAFEGLNELPETPVPLKVPPLMLAIRVLEGSLWHIEADELVILGCGGVDVLMVIDEDEVMLHEFVAVTV